MICPKCLSNKIEVCNITDNELDFEKSIKITRFYKEYKCLDCKNEFPIEKLNLKIKINKMQLLSMKHHFNYKEKEEEYINGLQVHIK